MNQETVEDLQYKGFKILQKEKGFKFGVDAVLAAYYSEHFMKTGQRILDLGTGTGIIAILIAARTAAAEITGIEIQEDMANMARRSVQLNQLENRVQIITDNIKFCASCASASYDHVISNPPYKKHGSGIVNPSDAKAIARHEILCTLEDVIFQSARCLKEKGTFTMVHRPERLCDIMVLMRKYKVEPKALRFVHPSPSAPPTMLLIRGVKGGNSYLKTEAPLYIFDENGKYTKEINAIYNRQ